MPSLLENVMNNFTMERIIPKCDINLAVFCMTTYPVDKSGKGLPYYLQHHESLFFDSARLKWAAEARCLLPITKIANST